jgi:hypothetical protein
MLRGLVRYKLHQVSIMYTIEVIDTYVTVKHTGHHVVSLSPHIVVSIYYTHLYYIKCLIPIEQSTHFYVNYTQVCSYIYSHMHVYF